MKKLFILQLLFIFSISALEIPEKEMVIIIPSYNNEKWTKSNLRSVIEQNYRNFRIIYINDCSSDSTGKLVEKYTKNLTLRAFRSFCFEQKEKEEISETVDRLKEKIDSQKTFFTLVNNSKRCGALANLYRAIHSCKDHEIVVLVDGDDWLYHKNVLQTLNALYSSNEIWMTHGKLMAYPRGCTNWCEPIPEELIQRNAIRQFKCPSHLRTFYAWLFKKIALKDLLLDGEFFSATSDMAIMFPITEMAAERHYFVDQTNYVYNEKNPINDNKTKKELQRNLEVYIRNMPPYMRLESPEDTCNAVDEAPLGA